LTYLSFKNIKHSLREVTEVAYSVASHLFSESFKYLRGFRLLKLSCVDFKSTKEPSKMNPKTQNQEKPAGEPAKKKHRPPHAKNNGNSELAEDKNKRKDELSMKIAELEKENAELSNLVKRVAADFENYKKAIERERERSCFLSSMRIISKVLPVLDNLEAALKNAPEFSSEEIQETQQKQSFVEGIRMIYSQLLGVLQEEGVKALEPLGEKFDPNFHEVLFKKESEGEEEHNIVEVVQKGYFMNGQLLRPAKVIISKRGE